MSRVLTCTNPPENSPVNSGVAVLLMTMLSISAAGKRSKENAFLSGSLEGSKALFSIAELYRSDNPLTTTKRLSCMDAPLTLFNTSPVFLSGVRRIKSAANPLASEVLLRWKVSNAMVLSCLLVERMTIFSPVVTFGDNTTTNASSAPVASTSSMVLLLYPVLETVMVYFLPLSSESVKAPSTLAITIFLVASTRIDAPGIDSFLVLTTLPMMLIF